MVRKVGGQGQGVGGGSCSNQGFQMEGTVGDKSGRPEGGARGLQRL